ncbi:hypothetical protein [Halomarina oriensis]|uniref:Uncharacterized protein n=1 Tax=Halomarina oriensis TaxID=671145 RepID=A0A6B0GDH9_9EURY|nr:hypothetical protein [Halomarina oriensis]MWG32966.1 hypothetical protein [Halomarina oriensis]
MIAKKIIETPLFDDVMGVVGAILSELERDNRVAVREHVDALAMEGIDVDAELSPLPEEDERVATIRETVRALVDGEAAVWGLWCAAGPEEFDGEKASDFVGLDTEEWEAKQTQWGDLYRENGGETFSGATDREIADVHLQETFGMDVDEFEERVIGWTKADALDDLVAGPSRQTTAVLEQATEEVRRGA